MLAGNITLPRASCDKCADATKRIEQYAGRQIFLDVRLKHGFKISDRPTHLPMLESFLPTPETAHVTLVPTKNVPGFLALLVPEPPGILAGRPPGTPFQAQLFSLCISNGEENSASGSVKSRVPDLLFRKLEIDYVARLLAKIALGFAVARCGVEGFSSTISDIILNRQTDWPFWVGGTTAEMSELPPPPGGVSLHRAVVFGATIGVDRYVVVQLQLLAYLKTPLYTIVVGKLNEVGEQRLHDSS